MQHHPGSWYMPWGVPLQKMALAVPFHPTVAAVGYHQTQTPGVQVAAGPTTTHQQQQHTVSQSHHQTYQTHQMHPATAALHQQLQVCSLAEQYFSISSGILLEYWTFLRWILSIFHCFLIKKYFFSVSGFFFRFCRIASPSGSSCNVHTVVIANVHKPDTESHEHGPAGSNECWIIGGSASAVPSADAANATNASHNTSSPSGQWSAANHEQ